MATDDHAGSTAENKAVLIPSSTYRTNGYDTISGSGKAGRYADLLRIQAVLQTRETPARPATVPPGSIKHAERYVFIYENNFKVGFAPYENQGHHLLPFEVFTDAYLTSDQLLLMHKVDYDVNNGDNIIFLPVEEIDREFHDLPLHNGSHPRYTTLVSADMRKVRQSLQKEIDSDPDHKKWSPPSDIPNRLKGLQNDYWDLLTVCGQIRVNDVVRRPGRLSKKAT